MFPSMHLFSLHYKYEMKLLWSNCNCHLLHWRLSQKVSVRSKFSQRGQFNLQLAASRRLKTLHGLVWMMTTCCRMHCPACLHALSGWRSSWDSAWEKAAYFNWTHNPHNGYKRVLATSLPCCPNAASESRSPY